jgi:hypothetical protein
MGNGDTTLTQIYNVLTDTWTLGTPMEEICDCSDCAVVGDTIYFLGGLDRYEGVFDTRIREGVINALSPAQITWNDAGPYLGPRWDTTGRSWGPTVALGGRLYAFGGLDQSVLAESVGYVFDPGAQTWETMPTYPTSVYGCCLAATRDSANEIFGLAGQLGDTTLAGYYRLSIPFHDVGVTGIVAPETLVRPGDTVTPSAWVKNFGVKPEGLRVMMRIDSGYTNLESVFVSPDESTQVNFSPWRATANGQHTAKCSTMLADDGNNGNDACIRVFQVGIIGLSITSWGLPDTADTAVTVSPSVTVRDSGTFAEGFWTVIHILPDYSMRESAYLESGGQENVSLGSWTPSHLGWRPISCSLVAANVVRAYRESVFVRVRDAGVSAIDWPVGDSVEYGINRPMAQIRNYGNSSEQIPVTFSISIDSTDSAILVYQDTQTTRLDNGASRVLTFKPWPAPVGRYDEMAVTRLNGDVNPANDTLTSRFQAINGTPDLILLGLYPADTVLPGLVYPKVDVENQGTATPDISSLCYIFKDETLQVYESETAQVIVDPGLDVPVEFGPYWIAAFGVYQARAVVFNYAKTIQDTLYGYFTVSTEAVQAPSSIVAPKAFALDAPSPNPSRDALTIRYALPRAADISLKLYDATGKLRALLNQGRKAAGEYSTTFEIRDSRFDITPGIYFVRLNSPGFVQARKVVIAQ